MGLSQLNRPSLEHFYIQREGESLDADIRLLPIHVKPLLDE
jgi:hypothetical protein